MWASSAAEVCLRFVLVIFLCSLKAQVLSMFITKRGNYVVEKLFNVKCFLVEGFESVGSVWWFEEFLQESSLVGAGVGGSGLPHWAFGAHGGLWVPRQGRAAQAWGVQCPPVFCARGLPLLLGLRLPGWHLSGSRAFTLSRSEAPSKPPCVRTESWGFLSFLKKAVFVHWKWI